MITVKRDDVQSLPIVLIQRLYWPRIQIIQREDFIPIIRVWGEMLWYILQRSYCSCQCEDCKKYYGVIELLDPCWWTQYASCVLVSNRQDSPDSVDDDVRTKVRLSWHLQSERWHFKPAGIRKEKTSNQRCFGWPGIWPTSYEEIKITMSLSTQSTARHGCKGCQRIR